MLPKEMVDLILQHLILKYKSENIKEIKRKINIFKVKVQEDDEIYMYSQLELDSILSSNFQKFILKNRL